MNAELPRIIREPLLGTLDAAGRAIEAGGVPRGLAGCIEGLGALPPDSVSRLDGEIASLLRLSARHRPVRLVRASWPLALPGLLRPRRRRDDLALLLAQPALAPFFLFHRNGYVREAALHRLNQPLAGPFWVAAIAYRLNDWVPQVRSAATAAARRVFPLTDPETMAAAAAALAVRRGAWRRWGAEAAILDEAFERAAVAEHLAAILGSSTTGAGGAVLRESLRSAAMDRHLPALARSAAAPALRAVATRTLLEGKARWPSGAERQWIDKSHGLWRRVTVYAERPVPAPDPMESMVAAAARDRSGLVRRVAADALIRQRHTLGNFDELAALLRCDRSPGVRARIAWLDRRLPGTGTDP